MVGAYYNQRIQEQAPCPPWESIPLHSLFAHRSHKSQDTPSCSLQENGVGSNSELWQLSLLSQNLSLWARAQHPGNTCHPSPTDQSHACPWGKAHTSPYHSSKTLRCLGIPSALVEGRHRGFQSQEVMHQNSNLGLCLHPASLGITDNFRKYANGHF